VFTIAILGFLCPIQNSVAQQYKIYFERIEPIVIDENVFGIPSLVKYELSWNLYSITDSKAELIGSDKVTAETYQLLFQTDEKEQFYMIQARTWVSDTLEAQKKYAFRLQSGSITLKDSTTVTAIPADRDWVTVLTGRETKIGKVKTTEVAFNNNKALAWLFLPVPFDWSFGDPKIGPEDELPSGEGEFPFLFSIKRSYDNSTLIGKIAFGIIDWCFALGFLVILICHRRLRLSNIFPYKSVPRLKKLSSSERKKLQKPDEEGAELAEDEPSSSQITDEGSKQSVMERFLETHVPVAGIVSDFWARGGFEASFQNRITEGFLKVKNDWKALVHKTHLIYEGEAANEFQISIADASQKSTDELEKMQRSLWQKVGLKESKIIDKELHRYRKFPIGRILRGGLTNMKINRMYLHHSSEEVDRAMENRASAELEGLKSGSFFEWLWNLGALSPLAGLLGTVTGISFAFLRIASSPGSAEGIVAALAPNINEALYTTILGLIVGIFLMAAFYYYKSKVDWIYSKWEEIYVDIGEEL
jgi:biopolymer transport protein ExbB/TolQ